MAIAGWNLIGLALEQAEPVRTVVHSVNMIETDGTAANRSLQVEFTAPLPTECTRVTQYGLYAPVRDGRVRYYSLGSGLTGVGLMRSGQHVSVQVVLSLPPAIAPGAYEFSLRTLLSCDWVWGLFSRQITSETTAPVVIR